MEESIEESISMSFMRSLLMIALRSADRARGWAADGLLSAAASTDFFGTKAEVLGSVFAEDMVAKRKMKMDTSVQVGSLMNLHSVLRSACADCNCMEIERSERSFRAARQNTDDVLSV